jgi:hypothetical protein
MAERALRAARVAAAKLADDVLLQRRFDALPRRPVSRPIPPVPPPPYKRGELSYLFFGMSRIPPLSPSPDVAPEVLRIAWTGPADPGSAAQDPIYISSRSRTPTPT